MQAVRSLAALLVSVAHRPGRPEVSWRYVEGVIEAGRRGSGSPARRRFAVLTAIVATVAATSCGSLYAASNWQPPRGDDVDFETARAACQQMSGSAREEPVSLSDRVSGGSGPVSRAGAEGWGAERRFKRCMEARGWVWKR